MANAERGAVFLDARIKARPHSVQFTDDALIAVEVGFTREPEPLTDLGNAGRLVSRHGQNIRYIPEFKKWITWNGRRWTFDEDGEVMRLAKDVTRQIYGEAAAIQDTGMAKRTAAWAATSQSLPRLSAMIELAKSEPGIPLASCRLDHDPLLLGVANGVVDLHTGRLRDPQREDYITKAAHAEFILAATCPTWEKFLTRILVLPALIDFVQRAIGYSLTGLTIEQILLFVLGTGMNGKSTLMEVLRFVLGDYAMQAPADMLMAKRENAATNDIARLRGARLVATIETEDGKRLAEGLVKQLTGGDAIAARFLFAEYFEFVPQFKIWLAANHKPVIRGDDYAIWRRIHLVPFNVTIPPAERDKGLAAKLCAESAGILQWAIQGCLAWQREGLTPPTEVCAATDAYKTEMDVFGAWIEECCRVSPEAWSRAGELYTSYRTWVETNGGHALASSKFALKLSERGFTKEKAAFGFRYCGVGLLA